MTDYKAIGTSCLAKVIEYESKDDWKLYKSSKDVNVYTRPSPDFNGTLHKTVYDVDAPPEKCLDLVLDLEKHAKFDSAIKEMKLIETVEEDVIIMRTTSPSMMAGLISPRDFIDILGVDRQEGNNLIIAYYCSAEHQNYPQQKGFVRGTNYPSAIFLRAADGNPNKTQAVNIVQFEGHLSPKSLVEKFIPGLQITFVDDIRKGVKLY
ncbi:stAR-related lipid transfer protein 5-like [Glandiceps talaboti]